MKLFNELCFGSFRRIYFVAASRNKSSGAGELTKVTNDAGTIVVFNTPKVNQRGQYVSYLLGDTKTTSFTYDAFGTLKTISAPGVQNYEVNIDPKTGNVLYRKDYLKKRIENFSFDNVNRLCNQKVSDYTVFTPPTIDIPTIQYAANGNITKKADVGTYTYDNNKIHAVAYVQNSSNVIPLLQQDIKYDYDRTIEIKEGANRLTFKYGPDLHRIKTELYQNDVKVKTKYFLGGYEKEVTPTGTREIHYIPTGNGSSAVYVVENGVGNYYYLYKDHLGSVVAVTNKTGAVVYEQSFDALGKQRNPKTWDNTTFVKNATFSWLGGFTGHEMLNEFGLVNMNNRMYDPAIGRMLAPDNLVQNPTFTQNYNRYSYVYNNPLRYTDPSGELVGDIGTYSSLWTYGYLEGWFSVGGLQKKTGTAFSNATLTANKYVNFSSTSKIKITDNNGKKTYKDSWGIVSYKVKENSKNLSDNNATNSTWDVNFFGYSYPGPWNPKNKIKEDTYDNFSSISEGEFPGIEHDQRYDDYHIQGASGLFFSNNPDVLIKADMPFVAKELYLSGKFALQGNIAEGYYAGHIGLGLFVATTLFKPSVILTDYTFKTIKGWF